MKHMESCTKNVFAADCLGSSGIPQMPNVVFGAYEGRYLLPDGVLKVLNKGRIVLFFPTGDVLNAGAAVITFLVNNSVDLKSTHISRCLAWEAAYLETVRAWIQANQDDVIVAYSAEVFRRSIK